MVANITNYKEALENNELYKHQNPNTSKNADGSINSILLNANLQDPKVSLMSFKDGGNMSFSVGGNFSYNNLEDVRESNQMGISAGAGINNGRLNSVQAGYNNSGSTQSGNTFATMGSGVIIKTSTTINENGEAIITEEDVLATSGINRDINKTQVMGESITTGGANINLDINITNLVNFNDNVDKSVEGAKKLGVEVVSDVYALGKMTHYLIDSEGATEHIKSVILNDEINYDNEKLPIKNNNETDPESFKKGLKEKGFSDKYIQTREQHINLISTDLAKDFSFLRNAMTLKLDYNDKNLSQFTQSIVNVEQKSLNMFINPKIEVSKESSNANGTFSFDGVDFTLKINSQSSQFYDTRNNKVNIGNIIRTVSHEYAGHGVQHEIKLNIRSIGNANDTKLIKENFNNYVSPNTDYNRYINNNLEIDARFIGYGVSNKTCSQPKMEICK